MSRNCTGVSESLWYFIIYLKERRLSAHLGPNAELESRFVDYRILRNDSLLITKPYHVLYCIYIRQSEKPKHGQYYSLMQLERGPSPKLVNL